MKKQYIWLIFTESKVLKGCTLLMNDAKFLFSEYLALTNDLEAAIRETKEQLTKRKLELVDIRRCVRYRHADWADGSRIGQEIIRTVEEVRWTNKARFTAFRSPDLEAMDSEEQTGDVL